ncbi:SDR family oxidoreductase [Actinomadura sp. KC345]|uniref:SDR family NAD(P)-dependent oxidoreductase n=1 Tax=Actinomadura sp. KC345 TaxID=2530371 RepID=UPI00104F22B2|nr:SDR family oxidoreductase [Actinomadura sp. KC345]TDC44515.1 SDR family oxidoreductase [Actinomadura sp. KC345]
MTAIQDGTAPRAVVITGAGSGIGRATARAFADAGARVLAVGRTESRLEETARGHEGMAVLAADITEPGAPDLIVGTALRSFGRLDVLVNNAAVAAIGSLADLERDSAIGESRTNLLAPVFLTRRALDALEATGGVVVNVGTAGVLGLRCMPGSSLYGVTKSALDFLTRTWAVELAPRGIRVVGVAPGTIDTGIGLSMGMSEETYRAFLADVGARTPAGRAGRSEEIAWWIERLARPEAGHATGVVLPVDGGWSTT